MDNNKIIELSDGYNNHTEKYYSKIIARDNFCVQLQCASTGKEYMKKWVHVSDYIEALQKVKNE